MKKSHHFAAFALAAALVSTATAGFAASANFQGDETAAADRAPALGGTPFIVEHDAAGRGYVSAAQVADNPLADRAATLGGNAFSVKNAEGSRYHRVPQTDAEATQAAGNPLAVRAATLGGRAFVVEQSAPQPAQSFLALFK